MRPGSDHLALSARALGKDLVWRFLTRHRPGPKPDIAMFSSPRSGSTWIMELVAANRRIRRLNQPLDVLSPNVTVGQVLDLPRTELGQFVTLDERDEARMRRLFEDILSGRRCPGASTRFWHRDYVYRSDRLFLKILAATALIDWVGTGFDVDIVYLTRHPIPQAMSCLRNDWTVTAPAYLHDERFVARNLDAAALCHCRKVLAEGSPLDRFVLSWALENLVPIRLLPDRPEWLHVAYERSVREPEAALTEIARRLRLEDVDRMRARVHRPSGSSRFSTTQTRDAIRAGEPNRLEAWREQVPPAEERRLLGIVAGVGVDLGTIGIESPA